MIITKKVIIFSLLLLLLLPFTASAYEDCVERYKTDWRGEYSVFKNGMVTGYTVSTVTDPLSSSNHLLQFNLTMTTGQFDIGLGYVYLAPKDVSYSPYFSYISRGYYPNNNVLHPPGTTSGGGSAVYVLNPNDNSTIAAITGLAPYCDTTKVEIIKNGDKYDVYANGVFVKSVTNTQPSYTGAVKYCIGCVYYKPQGWSAQYASLQVDDLSDSSIIGISNLVTEATNNLTYTWSAQLMRSYTSQYQISLYSLTNPNNAGKVASWNIPQDDNATTSEFGYLTFSRPNVMRDNFGLYMLEMTRGEDVLTDQYFYYDQLSNPQGFPQLLFLAESSVRADIRDDDNNGGEIAGGESVYLYPNIKESGVYNFTCDILETPYAINTEIRKVYNTSALNGSYIHYTGLSSQNYIISVNGEQVASTNGSDTWDYFLSWASDSYTISFAPDYSLAGVWGEVKNSKTQKPIKSASVAITGANNTTYLYTDDNGMYYLTKGMEAGKTYNLSVTKTGYAASNPALVTTTEGATTRTDFYLDPTSGEGIYYAPHSVTFTVLEYWYNYTGLPGVPYSVYDNIMDEEIKTGSTDSKGQFTVKEMDGGTNYTITLSYNGRNITEYVEPGLSEYIFVLNKEGALHTYMNSWLTLSYAQNSTNATVTYSSNKTITGASLIATASNGTIAYTQTLTTQNGSFFFPFSPGDYSLQFHIKASDNSEASQVWTISNPATVNLFPTSYPAWLKNTLFTAIILIFLLAFGKSKNDIACGSVAVLTSLGYFFKWLTCSFNFVVLVWIIAAGAIYLHYKRTGAVG